MLAGLCAALLIAADRPPGLEEKEGLLAELSASELRWLNLVDVLISEEELTAFLSLPREYQRARFIERFWRVRDPVPATRVNEFHEHWKWRAEVADEKYGGVVTDRGRTYLLAGPASLVYQQLCPELLASNEVWVYRSEGSRDLALVFLRLRDAVAIGVP